MRRTGLATRNLQPFHQGSTAAAGSSGTVDHCTCVRITTTHPPWGDDLTIEYAKYLGYQIQLVKSYRSQLTSPHALREIIALQICSNNKCTTKRNTPKTPSRPKRGIPAKIDHAQGANPTQQPTRCCLPSSRAHSAKQRHPPCFYSFTGVFALNDTKKQHALPDIIFDQHVRLVEYQSI